MITVLMLAFILTGCWDNKELEKLVLVDALGIDRISGHEELVITVEHFITTQTGVGGQIGGGQGTTPRSTVHQAGDRTLSAALDRLQESLQNRVFLGYVSVVIVGEEAAREDMRQILELIDRNPVLRRAAYILITPGKAGDVLATSNPDGLPVGDVLLGLLREIDRTGTAFATRVGDDLFEPLAISGIEPAIAKVVSKVFATPDTASVMPGGRTAGNQPGSGDPGTVAEKPGDHRIAGMAVFHNAKLVGYLDETEARGWGWVRGRVKGGHAVVLTPRSSHGKPAPVTFRFYGGKPSIKTDIVDNRARVYISVKMQGKIDEWLDTQELIDPDVIDNLEMDLATLVKSDIEAALAKAQSLGSDIFGFGYSLSRQHRREWNMMFEDHWSEIFPTVPVDVKVEASIVNTGITLGSMKIK